MISDLFDIDTDLKQWQSLLAYLRKESVCIVIDDNKAEAWNLLRKYDYADAPHAGNIYANIIASKIAHELRARFGLSTLIEYHTNGKDTSLTLNKRPITSERSLELAIESITALDELEPIVIGLGDKLDYAYSPILTTLFEVHTSAMINKYMPDDDAIKAMDSSLGETIPDQLKQAIGSAYLIKAFLEEQVAEAEVEVWVCDLRVTIIITVDESELYISSFDDITGFLEKEMLL